MKITIGRFDKKTGTVPVTFIHEGVTHTRKVNAVLDPAGGHDRKATVQRVAEVARGVAHKIALGHLT